MRTRGGHSSGRRSRGSTNTVAAGFFALVAALAILAIAPVTTYDCTAGTAGATCRIEERVAGLLALKSRRVDGIAAASSSSWSRAYQQRTPSRREKRETRTRLVLTGAGDAVLYDDEQRESAGIATADVANRIGELANGQGAAFFAWQVPLVATIFASLGLLVGVPSLVAGVAETVGSKTKRAGGAAAGATLLALVGAWGWAVFGGA